MGNAVKYMIPVENLGALSDKIETLNRRARKLGVAEVVTRVLGVHRSERQDVLTGARWVVKHYEVEVDGVSPSFAGWTFAGTLEHSEVGNVVRQVPGTELPTWFRDTKPVCDHCNLKRQRKDTYIVRHAETGELKQVGHQCVRDFLGHADPKHLAWLASILREIELLQSEGSGGGKRLMYGAHFLALAAQCVLSFGWVSKKASQAYSDASGGKGNKTPTASLAYKYAFPTPEMRRDGDMLEVTQSANKLANDTLEWTLALKDKAQRSDYEHNLIVVASKELIEVRDTGILASAVSAYIRAVEREAEMLRQRATQPVSAHFGTVGKREVYTLKVERVHRMTFEGFHGNTVLELYSMLDANGNIAVWRTAEGALEVGKTYQLKGTVKAHGEWKGMKQTTLTRCKVMSIIPETPVGVETVDLSCPA